MEPLLFVAVLAAVAVLVATVSAAVLTRRDQGPTRESPPALTSVVEAPDEIRVYIVLNSDLIHELYVQTPGATVQHEVERKRGRHFGVKPAVGPFGAEAGTESAVTEREMLAPLTDPVPAASAVERRLQATEGLPSYDLTAASDNAPIDNLLNGLGSDARRIGLEVPEEVKAVLRRAWLENRPRIPDDLTSLRRFVRIRAEFTVDHGATDGDRVLTAASHHDSGPLQVRIDCASEHVRPRLQQSSGRITATCFGIPQWHEAERILEIHPVSAHTS